MLERDNVFAFFYGTFSLILSTYASRANLDDDRLMMLNLTLTWIILNVVCIASFFLAMIFILRHIIDFEEYRDATRELTKFGKSLVSFVRNIKVTHKGVSLFFTFIFFILCINMFISPIYFNKPILLLIAFISNLIYLFLSSRHSIY